jgi:toxin-antitoxin system PIN domain toxin
VILVDVNLLVYAYASSVPQHERARGWLDTQFSSSERIGLPWESLMSFVRLVTNPRIFTRPAEVADAWDQVESWLKQPNVWIPTPTQNHPEIVGELVAGKSPQTSNDVPDVHLAALAISHGLKLATHDAGFAQFDGLRWFDPLA